MQSTTTVPASPELTRFRADVDTVRYAAQHYASWPTGDVMRVVDLSLPETLETQRPDQLLALAGALLALATRQAER